MTTATNPPADAVQLSDEVSDLLAALDRLRVLEAVRLDRQAARHLEAVDRLIRPLLGA